MDGQRIGRRAVSRYLTTTPSRRHPACPCEAVAVSLTLGGFGDYVDPTVAAIELLGPPCAGLDGSPKDALLRTGLCDLPVCVLRALSGRRAVAHSQMDPAAR